MIQHTATGADPEQISKKLHSLIRKGQVVLGGNSRLKIYGQLSCSRGKRMKAANRVFFATEQQAVDAGYRPCAHCMKDAYKRWKQ